jgi:iron complex outermembrane recepter protein
MSPRSHFRRCALSLAIGATFTPTLLLAQGTTTPDAATSRNTDSASAAPNVVVTGNPLRSTAIAAPTNVLGGDALVLRRGSTLGETLDGLPGLSSSYFGPNANRPMIRGQDGDRIRVLSNSGVPLDASALSYDHAVPIDPLVIERIEVLRGPAALLYGGGAMGGVVNAIDNRIPKAEIDGVMGAAELRYGGPATERGAGALVESGGKGSAMHADGFWRQTDDMKVP